MALHTVLCCTTETPCRRHRPLRNVEGETFTVLAHVNLDVVAVSADEAMRAVHDRLVTLGLAPDDVVLVEVIA